MDNVKTFFKTLFWTLLVLIVLLGGFFAYIRFLNKDLGQKVAGVIYVGEEVTCPVCEACDDCPVCEVPDDYCDGMIPEDTIDTSEDTVAEEMAGSAAVVLDADVDFEKEFGAIQDKLDEVMDMIDGTDRSVDEYDVVTPPAMEEKEDVSLDDLLQRIEELESQK